MQSLFWAFGGVDPHRAGTRLDNPDQSDTRQQVGVYLAADRRPAVSGRDDFDSEVWRQFQEPNLSVGRRQAICPHHGCVRAQHCVWITTQTESSLGTDDDP
jgi:hypothetical protein